MNRDTLQRILDTLIRASSYYDTYDAIAELEAELAQPEPVRREQRLFMEEQELYDSPTRRMCPNTYYECGRGCGDGPCKDFDDAYDIKEQP